MLKRRLRRLRSFLKYTIEGGVRRSPGTASVCGSLSVGRFSAHTQHCTVQERRQDVLSLNFKVPISAAGIFSTLF
jgi:hypothetical protein